MIVAVDGPAASGKGSIARAIARAHGLPHLDTGLLYRAVGVATLQAGGDPDREADAVAACAFPAAMLDDPGLRTETAGGLASRASRHPAVRAALLERQRRFATQPGGAVLDGRDIGTVIAPEAQAKLFVTAAPAVRARRRFDELARGPAPLPYEAVLADILARDARDRDRSTAPLRAADDACILDTSDLGLDEAIARALAIVAERAGA